MTAHLFARIGAPSPKVEKIFSEFLSTRVIPKKSSSSTSSSSSSLSSGSFPRVFDKKEEKKEEIKMDLVIYIKKCRDEESLPVADIKSLAKCPRTPEFWE
jgi:hypothetical protein